jgi:hypothetical protein
MICGVQPRMRWLRRAYGLSDADVALLQVALAPELDDTGVVSRPTIADAGGVVPGGAAEIRRRLGGDGPLVAKGLLHVVPPPRRPDAPLPAHRLVLDPQIADFLLECDTLDRRLAGIAEYITTAPEADRVPFDPERLYDSLAILEGRIANGGYADIAVVGDEGTGRSRTVAWLAARLRLPLLRLDLRAVPPGALAASLRLAIREARFRGGILHLAHLDAISGEARLLDRLERDEVGLALSGTRAAAWPARLPPGTLRLELGVPPDTVRQRLWRGALAGRGAEWPEDQLQGIASRYPLTAGQIDAAVAAAADALPDGEAPAPPEVAAAARGLAGRPLEALAQRIVPRRGWDDLVLPEATLAQLRELGARVAQRERVYDQWGWGAVSAGCGATALFSGPSGVGKTLAAEAIAGSVLQADLFRVDLAGVVSKYIGETEKNLDRIFRAAEGSGAVLFFDEADALFGKRSEVSDAHDRYANIEVSWLITKMDTYSGLAILCSNFAANLDDAFLRRLTAVVHFPLPDETLRQRLWETVWPAPLPRSNDLDPAVLAARYPVTGGAIRNAALTAAFLAASDRGVVTPALVERAMAREYQKVGGTMERLEPLVGSGG